MTEETPVNTLSDGTAAKELPPPPQEDGMAKIQKMMADPDFDPSEVARLITLEILTATRDLLRLRNDPTMAWNLKTHTAGIKALREMRQSLMDTQFLSKNDTLNLDGEKAHLLVRRIHAWFTRAMKESGVMEEARNNILRQYRDIAIVEEPALRREIQQINSSLRRK
jgi:hypothetical protein